MTAQPENPLLGIGLKIASVSLFVSMAAMVKAARDIPTGELVFFRSLFALVPILVFLGLRGQLRAGIRTDRPRAHLFRGLLGTASMLLSFFALTRLPLPEATAIGYATPLLMVMFSALFLHEQVRIYRWSAVMVGLAGVLIVIWPNLTIFAGGTAMAPGRLTGVVAALCGAVLAAAATLTVRNLVRTEQSATIVLFFSLTASAIGLATLPLGWSVPDMATLILLAGAGIAGGVAQILLTECYRHAGISVIAPFEYTSMLLSIAAGYVFFAEIPTPFMLTGGAVVVMAGIFIIYREHRLGLARGKARKLVTPQG